MNTLDEVVTWMRANGVLSLRGLGVGGDVVDLTLDPTWRKESFVVLGSEPKPAAEPHDFYDPALLYAATSSRFDRGEGRK